MSYMTQLILITPVTFALLYGQEYWLGARTLSLSIHLLTRATKLIHIYIPGLSYLTPMYQTIANDKDFANIWSFCNLILIIILCYLS